MKIEDIRTVAKPLGITSAAKEISSGLERLSDPGLEKTLHERAHAICFIARSVNFPVRHEAVIVAQ